VRDAFGVEHDEVAKGTNAALFREGLKNGHKGVRTLMRNSDTPPLALRVGEKTAHYGEPAAILGGGGVAAGGILYGGKKIRQHKRRKAQS